MVNRNRMKHIRMIALLLVLVMTAGVIPTGAVTVSGWSIMSDTEIYWVKTDDSQVDNDDLKAQVQLFSQEMQAKGITASQLGISYGAQEFAGEHDIVLLLDSKLGIAQEGYTIQVSGNQLLVKASDADGLFYGCRYVEQALLAGKTFGAGFSMSSQPDYPERAFFLDCGRKYYSPAWIEDMIREMSWSGLNAIYIHFSEEMGFRLESKTYPWLAGGDNTLCVGGSSAGVAADNGKYITQDEMREIAKVAKLYHVEIIPSLDSPGHMNYAVKKYNAQYGTDIGNYYHYNGKTAIVQGSGSEAAQKNYSRGIDISNEEAVTFARNLYAEYAAFFKELGCTKFDIGGDELLGWGTSLSTSVSKWKQLDHWKAYAQERSGNSHAVAYDAFMYYMNDIYELVKGYGYTSVRMWNDDALRSYDTGWTGVVQLNTNIEIQYWTPSANNSKNNVWTYLNKGYEVYNFLNDYNYYVLGQAHDGTGSYQGLTPERIYGNWAPNVFASYSNRTSTGLNTAMGNNAVKGSAFCVWCDNPGAETAAQVKAGVLPFLRVNGIKTWDADANASITYSQVQQFLSQIGDAPTNLPAASDVIEYVKPDMTALQNAVSEYETVDATLYTEDTFAAYTVAVNNGKTVLNSLKPTEEEVSTALNAIESAKAALKLLRTVDLSALEEQLAAFRNTDKTAYTEETYTAYKVYAESASTLSSDPAATQEKVDAAVERLVYLARQLRLTSMVASDDEDWFISLAVKAKTVSCGKVVIMTVYVHTEPDVTAFEVYDENGNRVEWNSIRWADPRALRGVKNGAEIRLDADVVGQHTYTVYAVNSDGYRSPDSMSVTVTVK